jgi:hypothetical protein
MRNDKTPTGGEMLEELLGLMTGLGVLLLPMLLLAVPGMILLVPLLLPAIPLAIVAALLAPPYLLVRALRRRSAVS